MNHKSPTDRTHASSCSRRTHMFPSFLLLLFCHFRFYLRPFFKLFHKQSRRIKCVPLTNLGNKLTTFSFLYYTIFRKWCYALGMNNRLALLIMLVIILLFGTMLLQKLMPTAEVATPVPQAVEAYAPGTWKTWIDNKYGSNLHESLTLRYPWRFEPYLLSIQVFQVPGA